MQTTGVYTDGIAKIISGTLCLGYPSGSFLYPDGIIASISGTRGNTVKVL